MAEKKQEKEPEEKYHWADSIAEQLCLSKPKSGTKFVCSAGITPSGKVHIGNFREMITVELVARAIKQKGREVKFIYSWDDFDRFRKIPSGMPKPEILENFKGIQLTKTPDTFGCHKNYAEHFEKDVEKYLPELGIFPEFIYESGEYEKCVYSGEIRFILQHKEKIKLILNKFKTDEKLDENWWPVQIYCEKCMKDMTRILSWDGNFKLEYECKCGHKAEVDFSKKGIVKLPWRIDWPMRWHYYRVDFEPGGKEHSTPGGSFTTASEIIKEVYNENPPLYQKYDFITIKGKGGKMSKSLGNVIDLEQCLQVYEPQILRYLFVKSRPNTEFAIAFDADVIKIYAEYDELEQAYFSSKLDKKQKRIYELSQISEKKPNQIFAPGFRQIAEIVQLMDTKGILAHYKNETRTAEDKTRLMKRAELAKNWLKQAPEEFIFKINEKPDKLELKKLSKKEAEALKELAEFLGRSITEQQLIEEFKNIAEKHKIGTKEFFTAAYKIIISKEKGPRLSNLIILEKEKVRKLLEQI